MTNPDTDPKGLIRESYRIDGIQIEECRSIFLDWAISLPKGAEAQEILPDLVRKYADKHPEHPMSTVLRDGLGVAQKTGRRGGRKSRIPS